MSDYWTDLRRCHGAGPPLILQRAAAAASASCWTFELRWQLPSVDREGKALIDPTSVITAEPGAVF